MGDKVPVQVPRVSTLFKRGAGVNQLDPEARRAGLNKVATKQWESDADLEASEQHGHGNKASGWGATLILTFQALGVVYGDIGTSPLYVFSSVFDGPPSEEDVIGIVSLIIWTLTAIVVVKYSLIVLTANDGGQGGAFALYSLLKRAGNFRTFGQAMEADKELSRYSLTKVPQRSSHTQSQLTWQTRMSRSRVYQGQPSGWLLMPQELRGHFFCSSSALVVIRILVVFGVGAIMGDGVLTPAISVVSAMEGLQVKFPEVTRGTIVGISIAILIVLFSIQRFGTRWVGYAFSPVILLWFLFNAIIGMYNIAKFDPRVFRAISPSHWFSFFLRNGRGGWKALGGVVLCVTGAEALYADMGHFSISAIRLSCTTIVWPSLILTYLGQAAFLTKHPNEVSQTYFQSLPHDVFWPMFVIASLSAVIASQALISAVFSIVFQAISQGFFPRFHITHTSNTVFGQVYIPVVNYVVMALTLVVVGTFQSSEHMGQAYGLAVVWDMLLTAHFMALVMITVWHTNIFLSALFYFVFATIDALYFSACVEKVPSGGWFSIMMAVIYGSIMLLWFWGSTQKLRFFETQWYPTIKKLGDLVKESKTRDGKDQLLLGDTDEPISITMGICLYYSETIYGVPPVLVQHLQKFPVLHELNILMTNRSVPVPTVGDKERLLIEQLEVPGFYHAICRYGYTETIDQGPAFVEGALRTLLRQLFDALHISVQQSQVLSARHPSLAIGDPPQSPTAHEAISASRPSVDAASVQPMTGNGMLAAGSPAGSASSSPAKAHAVHALQVAEGGASRVGSSDALLSTSFKPLLHGAASGGMPGPVQRALEAVVRQLNQEEDGGPESLRPAYARAKVLAAEIAVVQRELDCSSIVYVLGRAHSRLGDKSNWVRRYLLELPYQLMVTNTKADAHTTFKIPEDALVEVGMIYSV